MRQRTRFPLSSIRHRRPRRYWCYNRPILYVHARSRNEEHNLERTHNAVYQAKRNLSTLTNLLPSAPRVPSPRDLIQPCKGRTFLPNGPKCFFPRTLPSYDCHLLRFREYNLQKYNVNHRYPTSTTVCALFLFRK